MAEFDVDAILQAQSTDGEEDEEGREGEEIVDAQALDRRLEEILNAAEEDDDDDVASPSKADRSEHAFSSIPGRGSIIEEQTHSLDHFESSVQQSGSPGVSLQFSRPSKDARVSDSSLQSSSSQLARVSESPPRFSSPSKDARVSQGSLRSTISSEDARASADNSLQFNNPVSDNQLQFTSPSKDARVSDKDTGISHSSLQFSKDVRASNSLQFSSPSKVSSVSNASEGISLVDSSSKLLLPPASDTSTTPGRQSRLFSPDLSQLRVNLGTSGGQNSSLSSLAVLNSRANSTRRPGAALAAAAAASRQASTPSSSLQSHTTPKKLLFRDEPSKDVSLSEDFLQKEGLTSIIVSSAQADQILHTSTPYSPLYQVANASEVYDEAVTASELSGAVAVSIGADTHGGIVSAPDMPQQREDDHHTPMVHMEPRSLVRSNDSTDITHQPSVSESEDGALLLEQKTTSTPVDSSSPMNHDDDDIFDDEVPFTDDSLAVSSDDDANEEEILSLLTEEVIVSANRSVDSKDLLPLQKVASLEKGVSKVPSKAASSKKSPTKPRSALDMAEEAEKKAAFSGLHMEEGAAAQPMRLEGIQTGPLTIGYLHIDSLEAVSQVLSSSTTFRDHGTTQALSMHNNNLAVGLSKGSVFLLPMRISSPNFGDTVDTKPIFLSSADKSHASVTSLSFNMQGDLLLVGHANGFLALWELSSKGGSSKSVNAEHNAAIVHTAFLCTRYQKAISADCKGLVLLHSISWGAFGRYSITTQCLVDGQNTGMVLCLSPLLLDDGFDNLGNSNVLQPSTTAAASTALSSMVGGMVRGVVTGKNSDLGRRSVHEGGTADEAGNMVVFVTHQSILVVRLPPLLEKCAMLLRPDGIRDGGIPYIAWRPLQTQSGVSVRGSGSASNNRGLHAEPGVEAGKHTDEEGKNDSHPLLVLAWDKKVFILQLLKGELKIMVNWDLDSVACGVTWLEEQIVAILTSKEQICLFTREGLEVERVAIESDKMNKSSVLSYHTHILNTFGNPEKTYHNTLAARAATIYLLGPLRVWRARLLPWHDRIKALQNAGDWMGAFRVGMEVFDGKAFAVMGLPRGTDLLRKAVTPALLDLLSSYIDEAFTYLSLAFGATPGGANNITAVEDLKAQAKEQYARVGGVAIEFCVHIQQTDVLFDRVFNKFCTAGQRGTFLELLEPYILKDTLGALAPEVMQGLVEYYSQRGWVQRVEHCVLHMDIASLDFNQVVRLCRDNGLYSALIYLFNKGLDDFKSPLEELLIVVQDVSKPNAREFGYKMLVYLKYCLLGVAFPPGHGQIPPSRLPALRAELLQCLLDDKPLRVAQTAEKLPNFHSIIHPRLSYLLSFDLLATLEVLQYAFPEDGPLGLGKECLKQSVEIASSEEAEYNNDTKDGLQLLQEVVGALTDILERIHLYTVDVSKPHVEVDAWQSQMSKINAGYVMEFIAQYVASNRAKVPRVILARIVEYLASADRKSKKDEDARRKEAILVKLLNGVPASEWESIHVLELSLRAQFWQASACLLARKGDYVAALDSYMKDRDQPQNAFLYILDVLNPEKDLPKVILSEFRSSVLARLPELLQLSSEATLVIMLKHFSKEHRLILSDLAPYPPLLFQYLKQIMNARLGYKYTSLPLRDVAVPSAEVNHKGGHNLGEKMCDFLIGIENSSDLLKNAGLEFTNEMEELYVELLCQFEPKSVLKFLKSFEDYRLEHCLKLCQDYGITDAAAYLFERVGDIGSALSLVLADMDLHMHEMDLSIARLFARQSNVDADNVENTEQFLKIPEVAAMCSIMQVAIELCQRNTWRMYPGESEALWFRLFDRFVDPLRKLHDARKGFRRKKAFKAMALRGIDNKVKEPSEDVYKWKVVMISRKAVDLMQRVLVYLMGEIVNGMMGYIPLSLIMDKLLSDNGRHEFGDFKGTILQMLGLYGYEQTILFTAKHVVEDDMFHNICIYKRRSSRGYAPSSSMCCVCKCRLDEGDALCSGRNGPGSKWKNEKGVARHSTSTSAMNSIMVFVCGHASHSSCICPDIGMTKSKRDIQTASCPCCPLNMGLSDASSVNRTHLTTIERK